MILIFEKCKNSNQQGLIGLSEAINYFTKQQCTVAVPLVDAQDYDLIVDQLGCLKRVSVKTTTSGTVRLVNGSEWDGRKLKLHTSKIYDLLFVVTGAHELYLIPKIDIEHLRHSITLGERYSKYRVMN